MFPQTRHSVISAVRSSDAAVRARGLETLARAYWKPVYKYVRVHWRADPQDAEDLTQEFFSHALTHETFARYDATRARFRTFLRLCLDGFVANERKAARRIKRGGGTRVVPLEAIDFAGAEGEVGRHDPGMAIDPEEYFRREWVRSVFASAVGALRAHCAASGKEAQFTLFDRYDLGEHDAGARPTYAMLATELGVPVTQVTNYLAAVRREFRRLVLEQLRTVSGSDQELQDDVRELLGGR